MQKNVDIYTLNNHCKFKIENKLELKGVLTKIKFPALLIDLEFINISHNSSKTINWSLGKKYQNIVFTLSYYFIDSLEDLENIDSKKINDISISLEKGLSSKALLYEHQKLITTFFKLLNEKKIQTLISPGISNDKKIINDWITNNKTLISKNSLFLNEEKLINIFDAYDLIHHFLLVSDDVENQKNKIKQDPKWFKITSSNKFVIYFSLLFKTKFIPEKNGIYENCTKVYKLFNKPNLSDDEKKEGLLKFKEIQEHCFFDVLKTLYLLKFFVLFAKEDEKNILLISPFID